MVTPFYFVVIQVERETVMTMEMLKILTREKQTIEAPNPQPEATSLRDTDRDTPYP